MFDGNGSQLARAMMIRLVESGLLRAFDRGLVHGTVHTSIGQELVAVVLSDVLQGGDFVFGTHRSHHHYLSLGGDIRALIAEVLGREGGASSGLGGTQHLSTPNFMSNGIQGGMVPIALGKAHGGPPGSIAVAVIGDGTMATGIVYEVLNWAPLLNAPLLIVVEDNEIAQSTPQRDFLSTNPELAAVAFGWEVFKSTSNNLGELNAETRKATEFVRSNKRPAMLWVKTHRLKAHSKGDDNRPLEQIQRLEALDLLNQELALNTKFEEVAEKLRSEVDALFEEVESSPLARTAYPKSLSGEFNLGMRLEPISKDSRLSRTKVKDYIRGEISNCLSNPTSLFVGEDVATFPSGMDKPYSGAFGVSAGLSDEFPDQVVSSPIAEASIAGFAIGRALAQKPTIAEFMFADFATLAVDQVRQQASKIPVMYGTTVSLPVLFRLPVGGRKGYGPTHSQQVQDLFIGTPNLVCVSLNRGLTQWRGLYRLLLEGPLPTLVLESKELYVLSGEWAVPSGYSQEIHVDKMGIPNFMFTSRVLGKAHLTLVAYGFGSELALKAISTLSLDEISVELVVASSLQPWPTELIAESYKRTGNIVFVDEGIESRSVISSFIADIQTKIDGSFRIRLVAAGGDVGSSYFSESSSLLDDHEIVEVCREVAALED